MTNKNWTVEKDTSGVFINCNDSFGTIIAQCFNCDEEENAKLIVKAVNSHQKLVKVCKEALKEIKIIQDTDKDVEELYIPYLTLTEHLEQAIKEEK